MTNRSLAAVVLIAVFAAGCSHENGDESVELDRLATDATAFFKAGDASAELVSDRTLVLSLVNSAAGRLPYSLRQYSAHEAALWAKRNYRHSGKLASISIMFVERHWLPFFWTESERYDFPTKGLEQIPMPATGG